MADIVLIDLRASYAQFKTATREAAGELDKTGKAGKKAGTDITNSFNQADKSVNRLSADLSKVDTTLKRTGASVDRGLSKAFNNAGVVATRSLDKIDSDLKKINATASKSSGVFNGMGKSLISLGATLGISLGVKEFIHQVNQSIEAASNLNETISKTGELFGQSTGAVINWSTTASTSFGQSQQQALDAASTFAIFGRAAGLSGSKLVDFTTDFTELASDLASFNNTSPEEAINAIGAALRGEAEPIRRYGVLLDEATIKQEAIALGIIKTTKEALTPQQKVLAVQAAIYKQTAAAQGDFARTADGLANSQRSLNAQFKDLQATAGTKLLPVMLDLVAGLNLLMQGDFSQGISRLTDVAELGLPVIQEVREAYQAFAEGNFWKGLANVGEAALDVLTVGFYTRVKNYFEPAAESMVKELSAFDKAALLAAQMTDEELNKSLDDLAKFSGRSREEFAAMAEQIRKDAIHQTFLELSKALEITEKQYAQLVSISDKYGISARINSSLILDIKQTTDKDLNKAFEKFHNQLGVNIEDWNEYIGLVKGIPPKHTDLGDSINKHLIGPYDKLTKSVSDSMKALQDQVTLFSQSKGTWEDALLLAQKYADNQNALVEVNRLVEESLKRTIKNGLFPLIEANNAVIISEQALVERFKFTDEQIQQRDQIFKELGVNQVDSYKQTLEQIQELQKAEILASDQTLSSIQAIMEKYGNAIVALQLQRAGELSGALAQAVGGFGDLLGAIFGEAAQKNVAFFAFTKSLAIAEITLSSFQAIAAGIAKLASANPVEAIQGFASILAGATQLFSGIKQQVDSIPTPQAPSFFEGIDYVKLAGNPKGIDTIPAWLNEGEGVVTTEANRENPGVVGSLNDGTFKDLMFDRFVYPELQRQEKEMKKDFAHNIAQSILLQQEFNDSRLLKASKTQTKIIGQGFVELIRATKNNKNDWNI